jgi:4-cresol dehydrogenase (hydroxylating)
MLHWAKLQSLTQDTATRFEQALEQWTAILGADHTVVDRSRLSAVETATFSTSQSIPAILRPADTGQIQECLRIANRFRIPVYPVSSGKNWGYGSSVPVADSSVLLDLGRLNQIVDFSEELAYVTVEPGVTQGQLYEFLQARKSNLWLDATGAGPDTRPTEIILHRCAASRWFFQPATWLRPGSPAFQILKPRQFISGAWVLPWMVFFPNRT